MAISPLTPMPLLDFDVQGAFHFLSEQGLSKPEASQTIAKKLAQEARFDVDAAFDAGFTSEQVISKLTGIEKRPGTAFAAEAAKGWLKGEAVMLGGKAGYRVVSPVAGPLLAAPHPGAKALGVGLYGLGIGTGSLLGILGAETAEEAVLGDTQYLPSDLPFAQAGEMAGLVGGTARGFKPVVGLIPGVARSDVKGGSAAAVAAWMRATAKGGQKALPGPDVRYVNLGAERLLKNAAKARSRANRMKNAAMEHAQTVRMNPRTGSFELGTAGARAAELASRTGAKVQSALGKVQSGAGRVLRGAEQVAVSAGRTARNDPAAFYSQEARGAAILGTAAGVAEAIDPGDKTTRLLMEVTSIFTPTVLFSGAVSKIFGTVRHPVQTFKAAADWGNTKRSRMARDYLNNAIFGKGEEAARTAAGRAGEPVATEALRAATGPTISTPAQLADVIENAIRLYPEAAVLSPAQITAHPALVLEQAKLASTNPALRQRLAKAGKEGTDILYEQLQFLRDTASLPLLKVAIEMENEFLGQQLRDLIDVKLANAAALTDKVRTGRYEGPLEEYGGGLLVYRAAQSSLDAARKAERSLYGKVDPDTPISTENLITAWKDLFSSGGLLMKNLPPALPDSIKAAIKDLGGVMPGEKGIAASVAQTTTLGEMMKFRRMLRQQKQTKGTGLGPATDFDPAVLERLQAASLKDMGSSPSVRALVDDPVLNRAVGQRAEGSALTRAEIDAAEKIVAERGISENDFALARAYTFSNLIQETFHRTFVGEKLLQRGRLGVEKYSPETALQRLFAGPVTLQLQEVQDAVEFLLPGGAAEIRGFPISEEARAAPTSQELRRLAEEGVESDPAALAYPEEELALPATEAEKGMTGLNSAILSYLKAIADKRILTTREVQTRPGIEEVPRLNIPAQLAETTTVPAIKRGPYEKFLEDYADVLSIPAFSGLKSDLVDLDRANILLGSALKEGSALSKRAAGEFTLAKVLGVENPGIAISGMINSPTPETNLNRFISIINRTIREDELVGKEAATALRDGFMDWAYLAAGGEKNMDFIKLADLLYDTKKIVPTFDPGRSAPVMTILKNGKIVGSEFEENLKSILERGANIQLATNPGGLGIENVKDSYSFKLFSTHYIGATLGGHFQRLMPGSAGALQVPGFGSRLATELMDRAPKTAFVDLLIAMAEPGNAQVFADFLRKMPTEEQEKRGLQRFFNYLGRTILAAPLIRAGGLDVLEPEEEYEPAPPLPVEVSQLPDMQPSAASPSMQQASAPAQPLAPPPSPSAPPAPRPGEINPERQRYAAIFPNDPISGLIRQQEQMGIANLMQQQMQGQA